MIFDKLTRKRIASGQEVEIPWPDKRFEPKVGHVYTVQSASRKAGAYSLRVLDRREVPDGWIATVKTHGDPIRLLARTSGFTDREGVAIGSTSQKELGNLHEEPEAVSEADQAVIDKDAKRRWDQGRVGFQLDREKASLEQRLAEARAEARRRKVDVSGPVRVIERQLAKIEEGLYDRAA